MSIYRFISRFVVVFTLALFVLPGANAWADGTEELGTPSIPIVSGTGIVAAGVGLTTIQPGDLVVEIPAGVDVKQVILYWSGFSQSVAATTDTMTISVDGNLVTGDLIGGPTFFFGSLPAYPATYRADITALGLIGAGSNTVAIDGLSFTSLDHGAGVFVIIDDKFSTSDIQIVDGTDTAFINFPDPRQTTIAKTFNFAASTSPRNADLVMHFGSVHGQDFAGERPNAIKVTVGTDEQLFNNLLMSSDGDEWDSLTLIIHIPSDVSSLTVQALSEDNEGTGKLPASLVWVGAGLSVPVPPQDMECEECDGGVTELTLNYLPAGEALIKIQDRSKKQTNVLFEGTVMSGDPIDIAGVGKDGKLGKEIELFVNGDLNTKIHTSCSRPIGPGLISGDFEVVSGVSLKGGRICPLGATPTVGECAKGVKPQRLTMIYTGEDCSKSNNGQDTQKAKCDGDPAMESTVRIIATDKKDPNDKKAKIWFDGMVNLGGSFDIDAGTGKLKANTVVLIFDLNGMLLQTVNFHTSCSQPLALGDQFGSLILDGFIAQ